MKQQLKRATLGSLTTLFLAISGLHAAEVTAFQEDFESDGLGTRYSVENASDDGASDFFARRANLSNGTRTTGGTLSGTYFWGARDLDADGAAVNGMEADEARITFEPFSIAGLGDFTLRMEAAQGEDEFEFDNSFLIEIKIDDGDWYAIGGFRGTGTNAPGRWFEGDENTVASLESPRLTTNFQTFDWKLKRVGTTMQIRIKANLNGGNEEYAFDNLRVLADDALKVASLQFDKASYNEGEAATLKVTINNPAPAGGETFALSSSNHNEVLVPAEVTIPEGQTSVDVPVTIVADNGFDGDQTVVIGIDTAGFAPNEVFVTVKNVDAKPAIIMNEFMTSVPGKIEEDLIGDANGDGIRNGSQEEFIELVNNDTIPVDLTGWILSDDKGPRHVFPEGTVLQPGRAIVIFAGGKPNGLFGGAIVQTATAGNFGYGDTGDVIVLSSGGAEVLSYDYTATFAGAYQGVTRNPDITGEYVLHSEVNGALFSPGTKVDGSPFGTFTNTITLSVDKATMAEDEATPAIATISLANPAPAGGLAVEITTDGMDQDGETLLANEVNIPTPTVVIPEGQTTATFEIWAHNDGLLDGDVSITVVARAEEAVPSLVNMTITDVAVNTYSVVINEAFASVLGTGTDANDNGAFEETLDDQFIEIVNTSGRWIDISGWRLYSIAASDLTGQQLVHVFPQGTRLNDMGAIVVFGGGDIDHLTANAATIAGGAQVQIANTGGVGVNLTTKSDAELRLTNPYGYPIDSVEYTAAKADQTQSIIRLPELTGEFDNLHMAASEGFLIISPGTNADGVPFSGNGPVVLPGLEGILTDGFQYSDVHYWSDSFQWLFTPHYPVVYSWDVGDWIYIHEGASGNGEVMIYSYSRSAWHYTNTDTYPTSWNYDQSKWMRLR
ncbi:MAG: lamin tail domain-containing protein [Verrucomicrobiota bacterium JB022]|nr:lamin tail domain-containing protein [Verrucomicrobiota bacterium JB022]